MPASAAWFEREKINVAAAKTFALMQTPDSYALFHDISWNNAYRHGGGNRGLPLFV